MSPPHSLQQDLPEASPLSGEVYEMRSSDSPEKRPIMTPRKRVGPYEQEGDLTGWLTVLGSWLILFATFGYLYSFGVYQDYYTRVFLTDHSTSKIAWIGSVQTMLPFLLGIVSGKLFDAGYFHALEIGGSAIFVVCLFLSSLAKPQQYIPLFLSQGIGMGIGLGLTFIPSVSVVIHHFRQRRAFATGIVTSGSTIGAVVYPIMINKLLPTLGFGQAVRASAYIVLGTVVIGNCLVRTAYHRVALDRPPLDVKSFLKDPPYVSTCLAALISFLGFYFPFIYLQLYAIAHGIDPNLSFYSIAILNAASTVGRLLGNYFGDIVGVYNIQVPCTVISAACIFAVFGIHDSGSLVVVSTMYGLFAGAWLSVSVSCIASTARHPSETGARIGLALAFSSLGILGSAPLQGALLTTRFEWSRPIVFSGALTAVSTILFELSRELYVRERGTKWV
ncbi:MFS general substrate transporter [Agrocybe pediades]|nr:MFS general substrate transporter [Agrocybe pediades]